MVEWLAKSIKEKKRQGVLILPLFLLLSFNSYLKMASPSLLQE
jgi:hypothetical protein